MPARREVFAKADFQQPQNPEKARRRYRHHKPVDERPGDSFRGAAFESRQDARRLAERKKESRARRVFRERADGRIEGCCHSKPGEHGEQIARRARK